jgi:hypothetical protein
VETYAFKANETNSVVLGGRQFLGNNSADGDAKLDLSQYLTHADNTDYAFELTEGGGQNDSALYLESLERGLVLRGTVPESQTTEELAVQIKATNRSSQAISTLSFRLDFTSSTGLSAPGHRKLSSGALAGIGAAIGILCMAIFLYLVHVINKKKVGDLSISSSLSMRHSAMLGPENGIFTGGKRRDPYANVEQPHHQNMHKMRGDTGSFRAVEPTTIPHCLQQGSRPSNSSFVARLGQSTGNLLQRVQRVLGLGTTVKDQEKEIASIPSAMEDAPNDPTPMEAKFTYSSSQISSGILQFPSPNGRSLGADLFAAATGIGRRVSADSISTVFTNFSRDTELWGKSDQEEESNFSQTPSHRRPRQFTGTPRSGGVINASPSLHESGRSVSHDSPDESPTSMRCYAQGRPLVTITEHASREEYSIADSILDASGEYHSTRDSIINGSGLSDGEPVSTGSIRTAAREIFERATSDQLKLGYLRHVSVTPPERHFEGEHHSWTASLEGNSKASSSSGQLGDVGSILKQTSLEGFKARDSMTADAEETELVGRVSHLRPNTIVHTSIASQVRSANTFSTDHAAPPMVSSRRTGSCSTLPVITSSSAR